MANHITIPKSIDRAAKHFLDSYKIEMMEDLKSMWTSDNTFIIDASPAEKHKGEKQRWLKTYKARVIKLKGIKRIEMQRKIDKLNNEIENHKKLFIQYYM